MSFIKKGMKNFEAAMLTGKGEIFLSTLWKIICNKNDENNCQVDSGERHTLFTYGISFPQKNLEYVKVYRKIDINILNVFPFLKTKERKR